MEYLAGRPSDSEPGDAMIRVEPTQVWTVFGVQVFVVRIWGEAHGFHYDDLMLVRSRERAEAMASLLVGVLEYEETAKRCYWPARRLDDTITRKEVNPRNVQVWESIIAEARAKRESRKQASEIARRATAPFDGGPAPEAANDQPAFRTDGTLQCDKMISGPARAVPCKRVLGHEGHCDPGLLRTCEAVDGGIILWCGHLKKQSKRRGGDRTRCPECAGEG
jgi:hypothetical protein